MKDAPQQVMPQAHDIARDLEGGSGCAPHGCGKVIILGAAA